MKTKSKVVFSLCLIVLTGLALLFKTPTKREVVSASAATVQTEVYPLTQQVEVAKSTGSPANTPATTDTPTAAPLTVASPISPDAALKADVADVSEPLDLPDLSTIRNEVRHNPHGTPPSLMRFAQQVGTEMEEAKTSPEKAEVLFKKFERCVTTGLKDRTPATAQALCLWNADRLSVIFPDKLGARHESLTKAAPQDVRDLLKVMSL